MQQTFASPRIERLQVCRSGKCARCIAPLEATVLNHIFSIAGLTAIGTVVVWGIWTFIGDSEMPPEEHGGGQWWKDHSSERRGRHSATRSSSARHIAKGEAPPRSGKRGFYVGTYNLSDDVSMFACRAPDLVN
jgi:hypothetical protein